MRLACQYRDSLYLCDRQACLAQLIEIGNGQSLQTMLEFNAPFPATVQRPSYLKHTPLQHQNGQVDDAAAAWVGQKSCEVSGAFDNWMIQ